MRKYILSVCLALLILVSSVAAYDIDVSPTKVMARDNPFGHYEGDLPTVEVTVTENGQPAQDVTITATITHVDNLILPSGFPHVEGKELASVTQVEADGVLTIDALLFPLRGKYTLDVKVMDVSGNEQVEQFMIRATEPFKQSTLNAIFFLGALVIFGAVVGFIFGKDFKKKGRVGISTVFVFMLVAALAIVPALAHEGAGVEEGVPYHFEDDEITFYTTPEFPIVGEPTTFTFTVMHDGVPVDNAKAHILLANEEEAFDVIELNLVSQTGTFSFDYGIFDGAPHFAQVHVIPTESSSVQFDAVEREYPFAGEAFNPPFMSLFVAALVMLGAMLLGFVLGVGIRKWGRF